MNGNRRSGVGLLIAVVIALRAAWRSLRGRGDSVAAAPADGAGEPSGPQLNGDDPSRYDVPADRRMENWVAVLLFAAAACALVFIAFYVVEQFDTQLLGLAIGVSLALLAAAAIVAGKFVVPQETSVEDRGELEQEERTEEVVELVEAGGDGVSRRKLLTCATCVAGGALAAAAAAPLASFGPAAHVLHDSPWHRGVRLLDEDSGRPVAAADIQIGSFYTALPEGADPEALGSGLLVVKLPAHYIHLPASRDGWAPRGLLGFSKICPHAACAISLYRYPTFAPSSVRQPAFTCPCHYSTFLPGRGGEVVFGPAGRELPQLPLMIDDEGNLRAAGPFDADVGPSWWGVRRT